MLCSIVEASLGATLEAVSDDALDADAPFLHPRRRARLTVDGVSVGVLGEVHPGVGDDLGLDVRAVYGEIDVDALLAVSASRGVPQARALPRFPSASRDLALVVDESVEVGQVGAALRGVDVDLVEAVELFDVYRGVGIDEGKKSLAFRVVYRDPEATLTDKKVDKAHQQVVRAALDAFDAKVRG